MLKGKVDHSFKNGDLCIICGKGTVNIVGTPGRDTIVALEGDDTVHALDVDDLICAGPDNDRIFERMAETISMVALIITTYVAAAMTMMGCLVIFCLLLILVMTGFWRRWR